MDVFEKDGHKIILGDALEALTELVPDCSVDLVFADPPYNIGKSFNGSEDKWSTIFALLTNVKRRVDEKWWQGCGQPETVAASR